TGRTVAAARRRIRELDEPARRRLARGRRGGGRASGGPDQERGVYRAAERGDLTPRRAGGVAAPGRCRLSQGPWTLGRGAAKAQPAPSRNHRTGCPPSGAHTRRDLPAARPPETRLRCAGRAQDFGMTPAARLADGIATLGLPALVGADAQARLLAYLSLLDKWNRTHNLTAIREPERMITHHLLDSLAVLPHLPSRPGLRLIDVGSGGGLPGIPLAIVRPDWRLTLLD